MYIATLSSVILATEMRMQGAASSFWRPCTIPTSGNTPFLQGVGRTQGGTLPSPWPPPFVFVYLRSGDSGSAVSEF